jgi:hypothetical protein
MWPVTSSIGVEDVVFLHRDIGKLGDVNDALIDLVTGKGHSAQIAVVDIARIAVGIHRDGNGAAQDGGARQRSSESEANCGVRSTGERPSRKSNTRLNPRIPQLIAVIEGFVTDPGHPIAVAVKPIVVDPDTDPDPADTLRKNAVQFIVMERDGLRWIEIVILEEAEGITAKIAEYAMIDFDLAAGSDRNGAAVLPNPGPVEVRRVGSIDRHDLVLDIPVQNEAGDADIFEKRRGGPEIIIEDLGGFLRPPETTMVAPSR